MAKGDVKVLTNGGRQAPEAIRCRMDAAATAVYVGEPVKASSQFVIPSADAEPVTSAPTFVGIAASDSTQTASAAGEVMVIPVFDGMLLEVKAKSSTAVDTQSEIDALLNSLVCFDLTAGVYTVDTASTGATFGLKILGGDPLKKTVWVAVRSGATVFA